MLKRIQANYSLADNSINAEIGYMPTSDELNFPDMSWNELVKQMEFETSFTGKHQCLLCPKKVIGTDLLLTEHLQSKSHKRNLIKHYTQDQASMIKLKKTISKIKQRVARKYLFTTAKFQKLARLGIHYKL